MPELDRRIRRLRATAMTSLAVLGGNALAANASLANPVRCSTAKTAKALKDAVTSRHDFAAHDVQASGDRGFVLVYQRHNQNAQPVIDPLVELCHRKIVAYFGFTTSADNPFGHSTTIDRPTATTTGLYLDEASPDQVGVSKSFLSGREEIGRHIFHFGYIHPFGANLPAALIVGRPDNSSNGFGVMSNSL